MTVSSKYLAELELDRKRLNRMDELRFSYSTPPMRAVTGYQWSLIDTLGSKTIHEALDKILKNDEKFSSLSS